MTRRKGATKYELGQLSRARSLNGPVIVHDKDGNVLYTIEKPIPWRDIPHPAYQLGDDEIQVPLPALFP